MVEMAKYGYRGDSPLKLVEGVLVIEGLLEDVILLSKLYEGISDFSELEDKPAVEVIEA